MTDQPEKKSATEDVKMDFEGHRLSGAERKGGPERKGDITDVKSTTDDDGEADFEGHKLGGPDEKIGRISKLS